LRAYRELNRAIREIFALIREGPLSSAISGLRPAENPIVPTDLKRCRDGERGRRQVLEVAEADLELGFVHLKAPQACRKSLAELVDSNDGAFRGFNDGGNQQGLAAELDLPARRDRRSVKSRSVRPHQVAESCWLLTSFS
jgi:hypothetical protein